MSDWATEYKKSFTVFEPIKLLFENNAISRMYKLKDLQSGKMSEALGMNKGRYAQKLANPETFSVSEILRFSLVVDVDPILVINVIQKEKEVLENIIERVEKDISKNKAKFTDS